MLKNIAAIITLFCAALSSQNKLQASTALGEIAYMEGDKTFRLTLRVNEGTKVNYYPMLELERTKQSLQGLVTVNVYESDENGGIRSKIHLKIIVKKHFSGLNNIRLILIEYHLLPEVITKKTC